MALNTNQILSQERKSGDDGKIYFQLWSDQITSAMRNGAFYANRINPGMGEYSDLLKNREKKFPIWTNKNGLGNRNTKGYAIGGSKDGLPQAGLDPINVGGASGADQPTIDTSGETSLRWETREISFNRSKMFWFNQQDQDYSRIQYTPTTIKKFTEQAIIPEIDYSILVRVFSTTCYALDSNGQNVDFSADSITSWATVGVEPYKVIDIEGKATPEEWRIFKFFQAGYDFLNPQNPQQAAAKAGRIKTTATAGDLKNATNVMEYKSSKLTRFSPFDAIDLVEEHFATNLDDEMIMNNPTIFVSPKCYTAIKNDPRFVRNINVDSNSNDIDRDVVRIERWKVLRGNLERQFVFGWTEKSGWNKNIIITTDGTDGARSRDNNKRYIMWFAGDLQSIYHVYNKNVTIKSPKEQPHAQEDWESIRFVYTHDTFVSRQDAIKNFFIVVGATDKVVFGSAPNQPITPPTVSAPPADEDDRSSRKNQKNK